MKYIFLFLLLTSCFSFNKSLRGEWTKSSDGKTYLIVDQKESIPCELLLNGNKIKKGEKILTKSGINLLKCVNDPDGFEFEIKEGTVFTFNYWGP